MSSIIENVMSRALSDSVLSRHQRGALQCVKSRAPPVLGITEAVEALRSLSILLTVF